MGVTEPTRVLIVIKGLGPGGAERLVVDQLRHTDPERFHYEVFVCAPRDPNLLTEVAELGVPIHLGYAGRAPWPVALRRVLGRAYYHLVHAHLPIAAVGTRLAVRSLGRRRPKLVYTEHNRWPSYLVPTRLANRATIWLDDLDIAVSVDAAASMRRPASEPVVLVHGIDRSSLQRTPDHRRRLRDELGVHDDHFVIGTVANLRRTKNQSDLLRSFALADLGADCTLVIVGQGPLESELTLLAGQLELGERVRFLGYRRDATDVMAGFDIFTLPSLHEGRPVALMEAMALGLPVVVSDAGGMPAMVHNGEAGVIVPAGDRGALGTAFEDLATDGAKRARLSVAATSAAEAFDGVQAYEEIERRYAELLS